jgi:hypothetical protein
VASGFLRCCAGKGRGKQELSNISKQDPGLDPPSLSSRPATIGKTKNHPHILGPKDISMDSCQNFPYAYGNLEK